MTWVGIGLAALAALVIGIGLGAIGMIGLVIIMFVKEFRP